MASYKYTHTMEQLSKKALSKMTTRELKDYIRYKTSSANESISAYRESGSNISTVNAEISKLQEFGGSKGDYITLNFAGKKKIDLLRQARELKYFSEWDIYTEAGQRARSKKEMDAYNTFASRPENAGISYDEWRQIVEAFGTLGSKVQSYGYEHGNVIQAFKQVPADERKVDIYTALVTSYNENKGLDVDSRMIDIQNKLKGI